MVRGSPCWIWWAESWDWWWAALGASCFGGIAWWQIYWHGWFSCFLVGSTIAHVTVDLYLMGTFLVVNSASITRGSWNILARCLAGGRQKWQDTSFSTKSPVASSPSFCSPPTCKKIFCFQKKKFFKSLSFQSLQMVATRVGIWGRRQVSSKTPLFNGNFGWVSMKGGVFVETQRGNHLVLVGRQFGAHLGIFLDSVGVCQKKTEAYKMEPPGTFLLVF